MDQTPPPTSPAEAAAVPAAAAAAPLLDRLLTAVQAPGPGGVPPFALLRRRTPGRPEDVVEVLTGPVLELDRLAEIPDRPGRAHGALALVPFRQLAERGFEVADDGTPLAALVPEETAEVPLAELLDRLGRLPGRRVRVAGGGFDIGDAEYGGIVRRVLEEEIAAGSGSNFVIHRAFRGVLAEYSPATALELFRRLLGGERGAYWTFVVHTGDRTLVGASPEVHVRMSGGTVVMNPISGTYRYPSGGPEVAGLLDFLGDRKEREELSMVVDEELKMMCTVGDLGGTVIGPRLKEMAHLAHTEYELRGRSSLDVREVLKETMFAATVTGSPVENACRVIRRHEGRGRGYYAGALALLGRDAGGGQTLDSPILIRTADIDPATGRFRVPVGATLVRGSDPLGEVAETHAKAAAVLAALGVPGPAPAAGSAVAGGGMTAGAQPDSGAGAGTGAAAAGAPRLAEDPRVRSALADRRAGLAPFWLRMRQPVPQPHGEVLVVDAEDTFTSMLAHLLRSIGYLVTVRRFDSPLLSAEVRGHNGPVVLGPGPGDPGDTADPRIRLLRSLTAELLAGRPGGVLGICLGHELLADALGLPVVRRDRPFQGAQEEIELFGARETVGFYNSYSARCDAATATALAARGIAVSRDTGSGEVHALRAAGFAGVQFHPESVLTLDGPRIVGELLTALSGRPLPAG